jgi:hypothetical protein
MDMLMNNSDLQKKAFAMIGNLMKKAGFEYATLHVNEQGETVVNMYKHGEVEIIPKVAPTDISLLSKEPNNDGNTSDTQP